MVCRAWHLAVNDKPRLRVSIPLDNGFYKKLYDDLVKYPTFGSKICSIVDGINGNPFIRETYYYLSTNTPEPEEAIDNSKYFPLVLGYCPFIRRPYVIRRTLVWPHEYLESNLYRQEEDLLHLERIFLEKKTLDLDHPDRESMIYLQSCLKLRELITCLEVSLLEGVIYDTILNEASATGLYGGLTSYISMFGNLEEVDIYSFGENSGIYETVNLKSVIDTAGYGLKRLSVSAVYGCDIIAPTTDSRTDENNNTLQQLKLVITDISANALKHIMTQLGGLKILNIVAYFPLFQTEQDKEDFEGVFADFRCIALVETSKKCLLVSKSIQMMANTVSDILPV